MSDAAEATKDTGPAGAPMADTAEILRRALEQCQAGNWAEAERLFKAVLEADPENARALFLLGCFYVQTRKFKDAARYLRRVVKMDPGHAKAHNRLGMALATLGQMDQAAACYRRAIEIDDAFAEAHNNLGNLLRHLGELDAAAKCYRRVVEINPDFEVAHNNLGMALHGQGKLEEAVACFRRALAINPDFAKAHNNLGLALQAEGRLEDAAAGFRAAIKADPEYTEPHNNLGIVLDSLQQQTAAEASYRRALEINPHYVAVLNNLGNVLKDQERFDEAVASLRRAIEIKPDFADACNNLGVALRAQDKLDEAVTSYRRAIEIRPAYAEAHNNLGNALKELGKTDEARACFERAIALNPNFTEAYINRASVHTFTPDDPELGRLKGFLTRDGLGEDVRNRLLFQLAKAHDQIDDYREAFSFYKQANEEWAGKVAFDPKVHRLGVAAIKKAFAKRPLPPAKSGADEKRVPIFVLGVSRSGKTLLESTLARHEPVFPAGERHEFSDAIKAVCKKNGIAAPFPRCVAELTKARVEEIGAIYLEKMGELSPESRYLVDTMPSNYPYVGLIFEALPYAKMIYCRRDPLDNCLFAYFSRYRTGNGYSYDLAKLGAYYVDYQDLMAHWCHLYGDRILTIQYEKMVRDPAQTAAQVLDHCGLELDPTAVPDTFTTDEIGHWEHYKDHLAPLEQALGHRIKKYQAAPDPEPQGT